MKSVCLVIVIVVLCWFSPVWAETTISTVGPCGDFSKIQDALDAAVIDGDTEIRVQGDATYIENLVIRTSFIAGTVRVEGGWDCDFNVVDLDPSATVVDGGGDGAVVTVNIGGGLFSLKGMTLTNGNAERGGGIDIQPLGDAAVILENLIISGNTATSHGMVSGGGVNANLDGHESLEIRDVVVQDNQAISGGSAAAYGGGVSMSGSKNAQFLLTGCVIQRNLAQSNAGNLLGAGIYASVEDDCLATINDSSLTLNSASGSLGLATGAFLETADSAELLFERVMVTLNEGIGSTDGPQVRAITGDLSSMWIRDSGVVWGDFRGIEATANGGSHLYLTNLTVANNSAAGTYLSQDDPSELTLYNSIAFDNGADLLRSGNISLVASLIGIDPLFVDAAALDFHLQAGSPGENAGDNNPPGGLGAFDIDGLPRIYDGVVDIGMHEGSSQIFADSFETGDLSGWMAPEREDCRVRHYNW